MIKQLILATSAVLTLSASAAITVTNGTFEDPANPNANAGNADQDISGWFDSEVQWSSWHFSDGTPGGEGTGNEVLVMNGSGWVYQSIGTIDPDTTTLDWEIEVKTSNAGDRYQIQFFAGSFGDAAEDIDILGNANQPTDLGVSTFDGDTTGVRSGSVDVSGQAAGTEVWVRLNQSVGQFRRLDNLNITAVPVPEPSSLALLGLGGIALILRRRK